MKAVCVLVLLGLAFGACAVLPPATNEVVPAKDLRPALGLTTDGSPGLSHSEWLEKCKPGKPMRPMPPASDPVGRRKWLEEWQAERKQPEEPALEELGECDGGYGMGGMGGMGGGLPGGIGGGFGEASRRELPSESPQPETPRP